jgi:hypothetical protein
MRAGKSEAGSGICLASVRIGGQECRKQLGHQHKRLVHGTRGRPEIRTSSDTGSKLLGRAHAGSGSIIMMQDGSRTTDGHDWLCAAYLSA